MSETLTIVLRADGSGLTGTVKASADAIRQFGLQADQAGQKVEGAGTRSRKAARDIDEVGRSARRSEGSLRGLVGGLNTLNGMLATLGISVLVRGMIVAGLEMDRLERSTAAALGSQTLAARELGFVRAQAERLGIYLPVLAQGYAGLAAATRGTSLAGAQTRQIFLAVAEAGRAMNLSTDQIKGTLTALQQIAGKGTVSMEELRQQLGDRLPGAMQIAARSMKMGVGEFIKMVSEGKLVSEDFLPKFARELRAASAAGVLLAQNSPAAAFERLKTALFNLGVATARGGVLDALATAAKALTVALNGLVQSGAIQTITSLLLKLTLVASVLYVGGLLQRGLLALRVAIVVAMGSTQGLAIASGGATVALMRQAVATVAAAAATRGLATAMAFLKANPIMLAVTAVTLLATWLYTSSAAAREAALEISAGFKIAKLALDDFNKSPSLAAAFSLNDAKVIETIDAIRRHLAELRQERERMNALPDMLVNQGKLSAVNSEIALQTSQLKELNSGWLKASDYMADAALVLVGLAASNIYAREAIRALNLELQRGQITEEQYEDGLAKIAISHGVAEDAAWRNATAVSGLAAAMAAGKDDMFGYAKALQGLQVRLAGLQGGDAAAIKLRFGQDINAAALVASPGNRDAGIALLRQSGVLAEYGQAQKRELALVGQINAAEKERTESRKVGTATTRDASNATRDAASATRDAAKAAQDWTAAQDAANRTLEDWRAELAGPAAQALLKYARMERELDMDVAAGIVNWEQYAEAMGMVAQMRAKDADLMSDQAKASQAMAEDQKRTAEDYQRNWEGAISSVSSAFGDFFARSLRDGKSFVDDLKNIFKRWLSNVVAIFADGQLKRAFGGVAKWVQQYGNSAAQGGNGTGGWMQALFGGGGQGGSTQSGGIWNAVKRWFGGNGGGAQSGGYATAGVGSMAGFGNMLGSFAGLSGMGGGAGGFGGTAGSGSGQIASIASLAGSKSASSFLTSAAAPWLAGAAGAIYGWRQGGDTTGKALGATAYGVAGYGVAAGVGAGVAAAGAGAGLGAASMAGLAAVPVIGWIALAAIAVNMISGGKLFGTKFKREGSAMQLDFNDQGASGATTISESRQRSLFGGRKWRTTTNALDAEAQKAIDALFDSINKSVGDAASQLGIDAPGLLSASFRQEFDKNGNLSREFATIAGRVYNEGEEAFSKRLLGENLLNVAKQLGRAGEIEAIAEDYRATPESLISFATLALAMQSDIKNATQLWSATGDGSFTRAVETIERLGKGAEQLAETYARVTGVARQYGELIGGVQKQLLTADLNDYQRAQLDIELGYRDQVKQANALAKALGLTGARSEDLAKIEQLRALNMGRLQTQMEAQKNTFLDDMGLSGLSPLRDDQKLVESMQLLRDAVGSGDLQRAQQLSQNVLGLGRNLMASGKDYGSLYNEVTGLLRGMSPAGIGFTETGLDTIADLLTGLPDGIASAIFNLLHNQPPTLAVPPPSIAPPPGAGGGGGVGGGGGDNGDAAYRVLLRINDRLETIEANTGGSLQLSKSDSLAAYNAR